MTFIIYLTTFFITPIVKVVTAKKIKIYLAKMIIIRSGENFAP
jgi:hypothetical protein